MCMCIYLRKGNTLNQDFQRGSNFNCFLFKGSDRKRKKIKNEQILIKCGQFWSLNSMEGMWFSSGTQNPFFYHHLSLLHIECSVFLASHPDKM